MGKHHGMSYTPTYYTWDAMKARCNCPNTVSYPYYGAKGITICERWKDFRNFLADMGERPEGMTIDRIDSSKGYSPENCRWATKLEQTQGRSCTRRIEHNGETKTVGEWARESGISIYVIFGRLAMGWAIERALTQPVRQNKRQQKDSKPNGLKAVSK